MPATDTPLTAQARNYRLMLIGGGVYMMALQFGNPQVVLPWIVSNLGVAPIFTALIVPVVLVGLVFGQLFLGPGLAQRRTRKWPLIVSILGLALVVMLAALAAVLLPPGIASTSILVCALGFGVCWGFYAICHQDLAAKSLKRSELGSMLAHRAALGGLLTLLVTLAIYLAAPSVAQNHSLLLWIAVSLWLASTVLYGAIGEEPGKPKRKERVASQLRRGLALLRQHTWFQDFLIGRGLLLSVELAIPFYTIHATTLHDPTAQNLTVFVFATSLGLVIGGPLWGRLTSRYCHAVMASGAALAVLAGFMTLVISVVAQLQVPYFHAFVFMLLALARQGVIQARIFFLLTQAPKTDRAIYISIGDALMSALGLAVAFFLGWAAQLTNVFNPLLGLIALNMTAAVFAFDVLREGRRKPKDADALEQITQLAQ